MDVVLSTFPLLNHPDDDMNDNDPLKSLVLLLLLSASAGMRRSD
jgi:hypothetical protein